MTQLYRHYDRDGNLLYVGISVNALCRLRQHEKFSHWFWQVCRIEIETFPDQEAALEAECSAIHNEKPRHNKSKGVGNFYSERNMQIFACWQNGEGISAIARQFAISRTRVTEICKRTLGRTKAN